MLFFKHKFPSWHYKVGAYSRWNQFFQSTKCVTIKEMFSLKKNLFGWLISVNVKPWNQNILSIFSQQDEV